jgi:hypothetical protein
VDQSTKVSLKGIHGAESFRDLAEGTKIVLTDESVAEITGNPRDGAMLMVRILESPIEGRVGSEEAVFFTEVKGVV